MIEHISLQVPDVAATVIYKAEEALDGDPVLQPEDIVPGVAGAVAYDEAGNAAASSLHALKMILPQVLSNIGEILRRETAARAYRESHCAGCGEPRMPEAVGKARWTCLFCRHTH